MAHSCETFANAVLERLAAFAAAGQAGNNARIVEGLKPSWDDEKGAVALSYQAGPENLLRLEAKVSTPPGWLTLNLDLGTGAFEAGDVIGLVADVEGDADCELEMFIRSNTDKGSLDTELAERLAVAPERRIATALHTVAPGDGVATSDRFHLFSIRLPKQNFRLEMHSMHLFVLPAARGLRSGPVTLASAAG